MTNRTLIEKAEAMRYAACLPDSLWEFSLEHAVHVYNCTPMQQLHWKTPHKVLKGEVPDISTLCIFGCGAYMYLLEAVCQNKQAPWSKLMVYLGSQPGVKGYRFIRTKNNTVFIGHTAIFDEEVFPKCKTQMRQMLT